MPTLIPADVETLLKQELSREAQNVYLPPLPDELSDGDLPCALVTRTGGRRTSPVVDAHEVRVDVLAETHAEASTLASELVGLVAALPDGAGATTGWRSVDITKLPYENPDDQRASVERVSFEATLFRRAEQH